MWSIGVYGVPEGENLSISEAKLQLFINTANLWHEKCAKLALFAPFWGMK